MKRVKMDGTVKKIDWNLLVKETLDGLLISQQTLAVLCKVSQQSISNWKNRARNPGIFAKQKLYELAQKKKIDLSKYETDNVRDVITQLIGKGNSKEITRLLELYLKMGKRARINFLRYGNKLVK